MDFMEMNREVFDENDNAVEAEKDFAETEVLEEGEFSDTVVWEEKAKKTDNVGEASVEIDVESLVAEVEAEAAHGVDASGRIRRRLDAILERKKRHDDLADFDDYDLE